VAEKPSTAQRRYKEYLDSQPANISDNPIIVSMRINESMTKDVASIIKSMGKYVSLNITGNAITTINNFQECTYLTSITLPDSVTKIGNSAFFECTNLTSINIPNRVTTIEDYSFERCNNLTNVTIPNTVTEIGFHAFYYCGSLTSITIPNSVTKIGIDAFLLCIELTSVTFQGKISADGLGRSIFPVDLRDKYLVGGVGTYTTTSPAYNKSIWTKQ
jgi:hypothetical protein